jgi:hypothetical protein
MTSSCPSGGRDGGGVCARDTRLERDVAVKVLPTNLASDPYLRYSQLPSPRIQKIYTQNLQLRTQDWLSSLQP